MYRERPDAVLLRALDDGVVDKDEAVGRAALGRRCVVAHRVTSSQRLVGMADPVGA